MTWPVTEAASSPTSQATTAAASSGVPTGPAGSARPTSSASSADAHPVSVGPGFTVLTVMPRSASASASDRVIWWMAPLLMA